MTTTDTHIDSDFQLPAVLQVKVGVISIPLTADVDSVEELEKHNHEVACLLALIPEEDKEEAELDEEHLIIHTTSVPALTYATNHYFIDECLTTIHTVGDYVTDQHEGDICNDCVDGFIDQALDDDYTAVVLEGGVYLKKGEL